MNVLQVVSVGIALSAGFPVAAGDIVYSAGFMLPDGPQAEGESFPLQVLSLRLLFDIRTDLPVTDGRLIRERDSREFSMLMASARKTYEKVLALPHEERFTVTFRWFETVREAAELLGRADTLVETLPDEGNAEKIADLLSRAETIIDSLPDSPEKRNLRLSHRKGRFLFVLSRAIGDISSGAPR